MKPTITVREYARLTTDVVEPTLDRAQVSTTAFDWLCRLNASFTKAGAALVQVGGRRWLKLDSYVGVLESPCGTRIEILPKHIDEGSGQEQLVRSRALLCRMIQACMGIKPREVGPADLALFKAPLSEWVMRQFLEALDHVIKRGLRFDYQRIEAEERFLKGQLNIAAQMRQPPPRRHLFKVGYDVFVPDRAENRLLKTALERVSASTQDPTNWRLAHELRVLLQEVPISRQIQSDFSTWKSDRLMAHYQQVKPWCELILRQQMPLAVAGEWRGLSMLFPMERLFEQYVAIWVKRNLAAETILTTQARSLYLCEQEGRDVFCLKPDLLLERDEQRWVLDTKWKRIDATQRGKNYGLSQTDLYQLYAYGQKYLKGQGEMALIYPGHSRFVDALGPFNFDDKLRLWVLPFDLEATALQGYHETALPLIGSSESFREAM